LIQTQRDESSMGSTVSDIKKRSDKTPVATHGFVVLRDLTRVTNGIFPAIARKRQQDAYPDSEYFEQLLAYLKDEPMLYIEGLCANKAAGRGAGMNMMDLVHRIARDTRQSGFPDIYKGCKLSALVYVIQFYFRKFSYRFRKGCEEMVNDEEKEQLRKLNNMVQRFPRLSEDAAAYQHTPWLEFLKLLSISGFNAQTTQQQAARVLTLRDIPMFNTNTLATSRIVKALQRLGWEDQGYKMYFCFYNDPLFGVNTFAYSTRFTQQIIQAAREASDKNPVRESTTRVARLTQELQGPVKKQEVLALLKQYTNGGRKRRRKRTRKRALRKKRRRTKHKKKRRKTHKRKKKRRRRTRKRRR